MEKHIELQKEEYETLLENLGLNDNDPEKTDETDYFNAWNFGIKEEDCKFIIKSSL